MGSSNYLRKLEGRVPLSITRLLANIWPPFLAAGIRINEIANDFRYIRVSMSLSWYNTNYVGTHFGGSIYAMTDPFYMLMFIRLLGRDFIVWDKAALIEFRRPGRGVIYAEFSVSDEFVQKVRAEAIRNEKYVFDLPVLVKNSSNEVVAEIQKTIYVKYKKFNS